MRRPQNHVFSQVPRADIPRSSFDRSHGVKTTMDPGWLVPIFVDEVLPGDTYNVNMFGFARLSTPLKPIMDNIYFNTFFFFLPNRLLWDNWQRFNGEQANPGDSTDFLVPQVTAPATTGWVAQSMGDYFGLPVGQPAVSANAFWFRAYNLIYNEWFRDENLQNSVTVPLTDGPDTSDNYPLQRRGKRYDYFTSCLPWPQKGESVSLPLGTSAPILPYPPPGGVVSQPTFYTAGDTAGGARALIAGTDRAISINTPSPALAGALAWGNSGLFTDLSTATASTINQLRQAFQVQHLYERDARGGTRYTEIVRSHFGVVSPDARLQRPEYLGGGQSPVVVSPVAQTNDTYEGAPTPQGNLAAYASSVMHGHGFSKSFTEHGVILGLICIRADANYQQGINRMWSRRSRFDFYWPALSHIGEQAVLSKEIYFDGSPGDEDVFGYQERYAEYRYKPSLITGKMRSSDAESLDVWHLAQDFSARPLLNGNFIVENSPFDRIVAVPAEPKFIVDFWFRMRTARPMPLYGVPGLIDHF